MNLCGFVTIVFILMASANAMAFVTDLEDIITIGETPYELSFNVENTTDIRQPLRIEYDFPTDFETINQPNFIRANAMEEIKVKIFPSAIQEGTTYKGMIQITLGGNTAEKIITLNYAKENKCTIERNIEIANNKIKIEFVNTSFKDKEVRLVDAAGLPEGWSIEGTKTFILSGFEEKTFTLEIKGRGAFNGTLELQFQCEGETFKEEAQIRMENNEPGFTGLVLLNSLGNIDFEIIVDVVLGIIAAILLIAFIARMIKFLNTNKEKQTKIEVKK